MHPMFVLSQVYRAYAMTQSFTWWMSTKTIIGSRWYRPLISCLRRKTWLVKCQVSSPRQWFGVPTGRETEQGFQKGEVVFVQSASVISLSFLYCIFADFDRICLLHIWTKGSLQSIMQYTQNIQYTQYVVWQHIVSILATQSIYSLARLATLPPKTKFLQERGSISGLEANHTISYYDLLIHFFWRLSLLCSVVKCQEQSVFNSWMVK